MRQTVAGAHSEQDSRSTKKITILFSLNRPLQRKAKQTRKALRNDVASNTTQLTETQNNFFVLICGFSVLSLSAQTQGTNYSCNHKQP